MGYRAIAVDVFVKGEPQGRKTVAKMEVEIGRDSDADIVLDDDEVEYRHASILLLPEGAFIEDRHSDKTFLGGKKVKKPMPLKNGDVLHLGNSKVVIEKLIDEEADLEIPPRYCSVSMLDKCPHCAAGLPVNGVIETIRCSSCRQEVTFKNRYWKVMLEDLDDDYEQGGGSHVINFETRITWRAERPKCVSCQAELPVDEIPVGSENDIFCPGCGGRNNTYPAPDFARSALPSMSQIYCAERAGSDEGSAAKTAESAKPVVLSCPHCGGSLTAKTGSERTIECQYCGTSVFLPDEMWSRLNPARTAATWYLRFDGKRPRELEEEAEAPRKLADIRERIEQRKKAAGFRPLSLLPFIGIVIPLLVVGIALLSGNGPGWTGEFLAPKSAQMGQTVFALNVPVSFAVRNEAAGVVFSPSRSAPMFISVSAAISMPASTEEALALIRAQHKPNTEVVSVTPIPGGFMVALKEAGHRFAEVQVFRQRVAAGQAGQPIQAAQPGPALWCVAHWSRPQEEGPLGDVRNLLDYLAGTCGSLSIQ